MVFSEKNRDFFRKIASQAKGGDGPFLGVKDNIQEDFKIDFEDLIFTIFKIAKTSTNNDTEWFVGEMAVKDKIGIDFPSGNLGQPCFFSKNKEKRKQEYEEQHLPQSLINFIEASIKIAEEKENSGAPGNN
jgi:hypothetical protein